jgi:hypothetical protein
MTDLTTQIIPHARCETVRCCLCGAAWEEQLVAAVLYAAGAPVGSLCARCLARPPAEAAARLRTADPAAPLAAGLAALPDWPTPLARLIEAERSAVLSRFPLRPADLKRVVDDRYAAALDPPG